MAHLASRVRRCLAPAIEELWTGFAWQVILLLAMAVWSDARLHRAQVVSGTYQSRILGLSGEIDVGFRPQFRWLRG
jgi:hypothetical protein